MYLIELIQYVYFFNSPKRNEYYYYLKLLQKNVLQENRRNDLCKTRCAQRHSAYQHFYQSYIFTVQCFEVISMRLHTENFN